jgi:hypothetical protein
MTGSHRLVVSVSRFDHFVMTHHKVVDAAAEGDRARRHLQGRNG